MTQDRPMPPAGGAYLPLPGELETRARREAIEYEARERRRLELAEQIAVQNTPEQRIQIWERVHELSLPKKANHPLVRIIAADTELTIAHILEEQRRRRTPRTEPIAALPAK